MALPGLDPYFAPEPEWPGAVSAKFTDPITVKPLYRRMVVTDIRNGGETSLARNGFGSYFSDPDGLNIGQSKKIIHVPGSEVMQWRPSKRCLSEPGALHLEKPEGKKPVEEPPRKVFTMRERRHIRQVESKEEYCDRPVGPRTVFRENGLRAVDQPAREVDVSFEMQRKARTLDLAGQRNHLDIRSLGDKAYKHPEHDPGFHQAGGLIVGSTFIRGHFKKTSSRNSASIQIVIDSDRKASKTYKEKFREQKALEVQNEVEELTRNWESGTLKECDTKYVEPLDSDDEVPAA